MPIAMQISPEERNAEAARAAAMDYVEEAFALAVFEGVAPEALAEAALSAAMCELVAARGEDYAAAAALRLAERATAGEFSVSPRQ